MPLSTVYPALLYNVAWLSKPIPGRGCRPSLSSAKTRNRAHSHHDATPYTGPRMRRASCMSFGTAATAGGSASEHIQCASLSERARALTDGHAPGVDGAQVDILEQVPQEIFGCLLQGQQRFRCPMERLRRHLVTDLPHLRERVGHSGTGAPCRGSSKGTTHQPLEGQLVDQQRCALLVLADFPQRYGARSEAVLLFGCWGGSASGRGRRGAVPASRGAVPAWRGAASASRGISLRGSAACGGWCARRR